MDVIGSEKRTVFRERSSRKAMNFEEQIMSTEKHLRIFLRQIEVIVFIILQIFLQGCILEDLLISQTF